MVVVTVVAVTVAVAHAQLPLMQGIFTLGRAESGKER
jgi:hypothetical protein